MYFSEKEAKMKEEMRILKFLATKKDGNYYDVSKIFKCKNRNNYLNEIDGTNLKQNAIIREQNSKVSSSYSSFKKSIDKSVIDDIVIMLYERGLVDKEFDDRIMPSMIAEGDNPEHANSSVCKITQKGIEYLDQKKSQMKRFLLTVIIIIISIIPIILNLI